MPTYIFIFFIPKNHQLLSIFKIALFTYLFPFNRRKFVEIKKQARGRFRKGLQIQMDGRINIQVLVHDLQYTKRIL